MEVANRGWQEALHGFRWLRHMRAAGTELAAQNARALVSDWIGIHGSRISGIAWEPATAARRVIAWLQHSSVVLQGTEFPFYRTFLRSLAVQIRYLRPVRRLVHVHSYPEGNQRRWVGISRSGNWSNSFWVSADLDRFRRTAQDLFDEKGRRLVVVDTLGD